MVRMLKEMKNIEFVKEDNRWYIDLPKWTGDHEDLEMVAGADKLCEWFAKGSSRIVTEIITSNSRPSNKTDCICLKKAFEEYGGCTYDIVDDPTGFLNLWISEVIKHVLGEFPKYIRISVVNR